MAAALLRMSGHRTRTVFDRYNIVEDEDVKDAVAQLEAGAAAELGRVLDTAGGAATTNDEAPPA